MQGRLGGFILSQVLRCLRCRGFAMVSSFRRRFVMLLAVWSWFCCILSSFCDAFGCLVVISSWFGIGDGFDRGFDCGFDRGFCDAFGSLVVVLSWLRIGDGF